MASKTLPEDKQPSPLEAALRELRYESSNPRIGQRGLMDHHVQAILTAVQGVLAELAGELGRKARQTAMTARGLEDQERAELLGIAFGTRGAARRLRQVAGLESGE